MTRYKMVDGETVALTAEENLLRDAEEAAYLAELPNNIIKEQIRSLESTITARRRDEAILGIDNGWLAAIRNQISALRSQLT